MIFKPRLGHTLEYKLEMYCLHRVITPRGANHCRLLKNLNLLLTFWGFRHCRCAIAHICILYKVVSGVGVEKFLYIFFVCFTL